MRPLCVALLLLAACPALASAAPQTGRLWFQAAATIRLTDEWSVTAIPGLRFEYARSGAARAKAHYLDEAFVGPNWSTHLGDLTLTLSLWYCYVDLPSATGATPLTHNLELMPALDWREGPLRLTLRAIFHNTLYASVYPVGQRWGFGTVMRGLVQASWQVSDRTSVFLGEEPWFALIGNVGAAPASAAGFWEPGFRLNRVTAGVEFKAPSGVTLSPQYVLDATVGDDGRLAEMEHYVYLTVSWVLDVR